MKQISLYFCVLQYQNCKIIIVVKLILFMMGDQTDLCCKTCLQNMNLKIEACLKD